MKLLKLLKRACADLSKKFSKGPKGGIYVCPGEGGGGGPKEIYKVFYKIIKVHTIVL